MATLTEEEVPDRLEEMLSLRAAESPRLERLHLYLADFDYSGGARPGSENWRRGPLRWLNAKAPAEVRRLAEISRVNVLKFVVAAKRQAMFVDGYRAPKQGEDLPAWEVWQSNGMDARQIGIHGAALSYGVSYATVLPGDPVPVIRGVSPRKLTAAYGDDDLWPELALEERKAQKGRARWRLYDDTYVWTIEGPEGSPTGLTISSEEHGAGVCPVVRYQAGAGDDGEPSVGEVEPLLALQDQINITTFGLLVAQHYGAFRQRYIMGWMAKSEEEGLSASARKLWTFEDNEVKVGEFNQTDLGGYLESREASLRHMATISQTPAHELIGQLINLSAEALAAAEASFRRAVTERQVHMGESHEQVLALTDELEGREPDPASEVVWRDTEARSLAQAVDAWGKAVQMLGIPPEELWELIPGVTQQQVERWKVAAAKGSAIDQLNATLARQAQTAAGGAGAPTPPPAAPPEPFRPPARAGRPPGSMPMATR